MEGLPSRTKAWVLTQDAFEKFLACLDGDRERAGEKYETIRRKLVKFFEWRSTVSPEEHADDTINRVSRRIDEGEEIHNVSHYCMGVARMVVKEWTRKWSVPDQPPLSQHEDTDEAEVRLKCLEQCIVDLPSETQKLIVGYYQEEKHAKIKNRKQLAEQLGLPLNALRIRVHRIRGKLEECVSECAKSQRAG